MYEYELVSQTNCIYFRTRELRALARNIATSQRQAVFPERVQERPAWGDLTICTVRRQGEDARVHYCPPHSSLL